MPPWYFFNRPLIKIKSLLSESLNTHKVRSSYKKGDQINSHIKILNIYSLIKKECMAISDD